MCREVSQNQEGVLDFSRINLINRLIIKLMQTFHLDQEKEVNKDTKLIQSPLLQNTCDLRRPGDAENHQNLGFLSSSLIFTELRAFKHFLEQKGKRA